MSETLAWDLNLPMTTGPPFLPDLLQAFVICVGRPPLLLTLCDKGDHSAEVETYCSETARVLHWSLLHFCHLDFTVLRVSATRQDFLRETVSLEEKVKAKAAQARRYFKSPMNLTEDTFTVLRDATTALVGATFVPFLLEDVPRGKVRNSHCLSLCSPVIRPSYYFLVFAELFPYIPVLWDNKIGTDISPYRVPLLTHQKLKNQTLFPSLLPSRTDIIQERQKRRQLTVTPCFTVEVNSLSLSLSVSMCLLFYLGSKRLQPLYDGCLERLTNDHE